MRVTSKFVILTAVLASSSLAAFAPSVRAQVPKSKSFRISAKMIGDSVVNAYLGEPPDQPYDTLIVRRHWPKLRKEMTEKEVGRLLGSPSSYEFDGESGFLYWQYENREVVFSTVTKKVTDWYMQ